MGGYFDGTLGSDPVHQDRPHHGARLIDLRARRRNSEAVCKKIPRAKERRCKYGPTTALWRFWKRRFALNFCAAFQVRCARRATRTTIGQELKTLYQVPIDLPQGMLTRLMNAPHEEE
jgi:hypothetical protein